MLDADAGGPTMHAKRMKTPRWQRWPVLHFAQVPDSTILATVPSQQPVLGNEVPVPLHPQAPESHQSQSWSPWRQERGNAEH